jgi:hypothetical protein
VATKSTVKKIRAIVFAIAWPPGEAQESDQS